MSFNKIFIAVVSLSLYSFAQKDTALTITEVMFNAPAGANQFVELFNLSYSDTIDLEYYQIQYENTTPNYIVDAGYGTMLAPRNYAVICQSIYYFSSGIYKSIIPQTALRLKIYDDVFGIIGMISTAPRTISLLDKNKNLIEAYTYSPDQTTPGISDEKYLLTKDNSAANWRNSTQTLGSPGKKNTVTPSMLDISVSLSYEQPPPLLSHLPVTLSVVIRNKGTQTAADVKLAIYHDSNLDSAAQAGELISSVSGLSIPPHDSLIRTIQTASLDAGRQQFIAVASLYHDEFTNDNTSILSFSVYDEAYSYNNVIVNEIMYAPANNEPEWIELYNRSSASVDLQKWQVADAAHKSTISTTSSLILPHNFLVLTKDSTLKQYYPFSFPIRQMQLPPLNNTGDYLVLRDSLGSIIDSVKFGAATSGSYGYSLERVFSDSSSNSSGNWKQSVSPYHATPGRKNSVTPKDYDAALSIGPTKSYDTTGARLPVSCMVRNIGLQPFSNARLVLSHDYNLDSLASASEYIQVITLPDLAAGDSISYNLITDTLRSGLQQYILSVIFSNDEDTTDNVRAFRIRVISFNEQRNDIVINEIQYAPPSGEGEWFELYNTSEKSIDLANYHFADSRDTVALIKHSLLLLPHSYLLIARDSVLAHKYLLPAPLYVATFPTLNNDGDKVILMDSLFRVIDSLAYPNLSGTNGRSLERISPAAASTLLSNWALCKNKYGESPGFSNSVTIKKFDVTAKAISFNPAAPLKDEKVFPSVSVKNLGTSDAGNITIRFFINSSSGPSDSILTTANIGTLKAGDSVMFQSTVPFQISGNAVNCKVVAFAADDEDTTNNSAIALISPRTKSPAVVINEIMFSPPKGCPEWIELHNISSDTANLKAWTVSDIYTIPQTVLISAGDLNILPGAYCVLSRDSLPSVFSIGNRVLQKCSLPALNDDGDGVIIRDQNGNTIDSVQYTSLWRTKTGRSLERISAYRPSADSANWLFSYSVNGATPGRKNSTDTLLSFQKNDLMVNEILYDPAQGSAGFIEFYNNSSTALRLSGLTVDIAEKHKFYLADTLVDLPQGAYYILAADSFSCTKFPWLNGYAYKNCTMTDLGLLSAGTSIVLHDGTENCIDSLFYLPGWHTAATKDAKNHSLEKINPGFESGIAKNWMTCSAPTWSTPGKQNSLKVIPQAGNANLSFSPNPFSPDNDGYEDITTISFSEAYSPAFVTITIFDDKGRKVRKLLNNETLPMPAAVLFDGRNDDKNPLRIGMYIVLAEITNPVDGSKDVKKGVVVVARKLK